MRRGGDAEVGRSVATASKLGGSALGWFARRAPSRMARSSRTSSLVYNFIVHKSQMLTNANNVTNHNAISASPKTSTSGVCTASYLNGITHATRERGATN